MPKKRAARRSVLNRAPVQAKNGHMTGIFFIMLNVLFWGLAPAIIKHGIGFVSPQAFLYYRFLIVIILTTPFLFLGRKKYGTIKTPGQLLQLLTIGFITNPLCLGLLFVGLHYTTSAAGAIIAGTSPLFIVVMSALFLKEKITRNEVIGAILGTVGTVMIVLETPIQADAPNPLLGNALIFLYNFIWAAAVLSMKKLANKHEPFLFGYTGWFMGMLVMGLITFKTDPIIFMRPLMLLGMWDALWPIIYMAIFASIVGFTAYQVAQKYLPASEAGIFTYLQPVVTIPLSLFWLHEDFGTLFVTGCIVLILGVLIAEFHKSSRLKALVSHRR